MGGEAHKIAPAITVDFETPSATTRIKCDRPQENQQKGDDTGTCACHGTLSVTCTAAYVHI